jgi:dihydroxy-acid dehydratase
VRIGNLFLNPRSHGFVVGHVVPEAQDGGPIALVQDGDIIKIDAVSNTLDVEVSDAELSKRRESWSAPALKITQGHLLKYTRNVSDASKGCGE